MGDKICQLQELYCPPIDPALLSAIVSDYDISDPQSYTELCETLDVLKDSAVEAEAATFDPSGSGGLLNDDASSTSSAGLAQSWHGEISSSSGVTDTTEFTDVAEGLKHLRLQDEEHELDVEKRHEGTEKLSVAEKEATLQDMFPNAKTVDISFTLKKAGNSFARSVETLLNQAFIEEDGENRGEIVKRGIDGFSESGSAPRRKKAKGKRKQMLRRTSSTPGPLSEKTSNSPSALSRWDRAKEDIDFIAQRTFVSPQTLSSMYHKSGASLSITVFALCQSQEVSANPYISTASAQTIEAHIAELRLDFPSIPWKQVDALVRLTHPSTASAHELARVLISPTFRANESSTIIPQYLPRPRSPNFVTRQRDSNLQPLPAASASALASTRSLAFDQAHSAYRKSKSNNLMGGAAAYYSSVGRDAHASLRKHEAAEADGLVARQSRSGEVDLHGTTVQDAVRITRDRVEDWWERSGRERARAGKVMGGGGLKIITGQGRHSEGGRGKLGPAVAGMLVREGWKIEVGQGSIDVVGRSRS